MSRYSGFVSRQSLWEEGLFGLDEIDFVIKEYQVAKVYLKVHNAIANPLNV
jgi:hypothetical protein